MLWRYNLFGGYAELVTVSTTTDAKNGSYQRRCHSNKKIQYNKYIKQAFMVREARGDID